MNDDDNLSIINQLKEKYPPIIVEEAPEPSLSYDVHGERLMICKIENENFKSYGGIRILGPFHQNFTCVIGPNGSGKSNVIDSLLFVFGFRASKIRSKKLSVLIHKSEYFPNVESCSVRVFFQKIKPLGNGDNDYEIIPNSEFVVARSAFKDNSSIYKINEKRVNNKEVSDFLKKQGIDLDHNRFLILQGEVEQIALMKPKASNEHEDGLLEYLEDIIGSHRFKEPLQILFSRLEELCDLRNEKLTRVKIVDKEKKELEGVRNDAVKYLRLCNEIVVRKNISFQLKIHDFKQLEASAVDKQDKVKSELEQITAEIDKINSLREIKEMELKETVQKHLMKVHQFDSAQKEFQFLDIEDTKLRDKRKHFKAKIDELAKKMKLKYKERIKFEKVPDESVPRIEQLTDEIVKLEELKQIELENRERVQISLEEETKELGITKNLKSDELREKQEILLKQEAELSSKKCELQLLVGNYEKEIKAFDELESKSNLIKEKIIENKEQLNKLNIDIPKITAEYEKTISKLGHLKEEEKILASEVDQLLHKLNAGRSKEIEHKVISFLFAQQKMGKISGVVGRLGNLASVEPKYDVAISTACNRLDNIITEDINNAQQCVELMKANNISRSTFIGLDKVKSWESKAEKFFNQIPNAPRAFDLLTIPNIKFRSVFYFAMKDLLIVNDNRDSIRINRSKMKFRIVTMKGEITEIHGAMTGGGSRSILGKICTDASKIQDYTQTFDSRHANDPQNIEKTLREKEQKLIAVRQEINLLIANRDRFSVDKVNAINSQKYCNDTLKHLYSDEVEINKEIALSKERLLLKKPDEVQVKTIKSEIDNLDKKYKKDIANVNVISTEVDKISEEILSIGVARLGSIKSRLDSTVEKIKEKSTTLKKINLSVKNAEKICKRTVAELETLESDKIKFEEQLKEIDITLKDLESKAEKTLRIYQEIGEEVNDLLKTKEEQTREQSKVHEEVQKSKQIQIQIQREYDERKQNVDQFKMRIKQTQDEIKKLKLYPLPEGVDEDDDVHSFMDLIGGNTNDENIFSSLKDSHTGTQLKIYTDEELEAFTVQQIPYQEMEEQLQRQRPNLAAIEEYRMKEELYLQRAEELKEVTQLRDYQREQLEKMKRQRHLEFTVGFKLITSKLKEMYQMITMGGDAELELVDSLDPFSEGILFSVRPPKKSWKNISNLSGGEKTLSSLALVFALHHFKPTPFYVMDEIDAALDFKNVSIVANYLKERTKNAQFIIISLRNNMYELSDRLVGIYKPFNVSKVCVINPNKLSHCLQSTKINPTSSQKELNLNPQNTPLDTNVS